MRHRRRRRNLFTIVLLIYAIFMTIVAWKSVRKAEASGAEAPVPGEAGTKSEAEGECSRISAGAGFLSETGRDLPEQTDVWKLVLVNKWNPLEEDYAAELKEIEQDYLVDARIVKDLEEMLGAARRSGFDPRICSAYRSYEKQQKLYYNKVREYLNLGYSTAYSEEEAGKWVAYPGTSEHQSGLAVDIVSADYQMLDEGQENTPEQKWLMEHCWEYGFILRYPSECSEITGIYYEPWHYRYVGKQAAAEIWQDGICLEEYLENLS